MKYEKSFKYNNETYNKRIMGPNPIKLLEELMLENKTPKGAAVMDLGSGQGVTSVFLAKEYGFKVTACDLWSDPDENRSFFKEVGLSDNEIIPVKADATDLKFEKVSFDAVISTDSYNYFGRDPEYLGSKLLPFVKKGGYLYICVPGMVRDIHDNLPNELLLSWTPEQLDYLHDVNYWRGIIGKTEGIDILAIKEMQSNEEVWNDWLSQDNEYAVGDRKSMEAGAGKYLNFIAIILHKK